MVTISIDIPDTKKDIICPVCGMNCNLTGLQVILGVLQPCDECQDMAQFEYWEQQNTIEQHIARLNP